MKTQLTITWDDQDIDVEVVYTVSQSCQGARDSLGMQLEPDEEGGVEVESVRRLDTGEEIDDADLRSDLEQEINEEERNDREAALERCWERDILPIYYPAPWLDQRIDVLRHGRRMSPNAQGSGTPEDAR